MLRYVIEFALCGTISLCLGLFLTSGTISGLNFIVALWAYYEAASTIGDWKEERRWERLCKGSDAHRAWYENALKEHELFRQRYEQQEGA